MRLTFVITSSLVFSLIIFGAVRLPVANAEPGETFINTGIQIGGFVADGDTLINSATGIIVVYGDTSLTNNGMIINHGSIFLAGYIDNDSSGDADEITHIANEIDGVLMGTVVNRGTFHNEGILACVGSDPLGNTGHKSLSDDTSCSLGLTEGIHATNGRVEVGQPLRLFGMSSELLAKEESSGGSAVLRWFDPDDTMVREKAFPVPVFNDFFSPDEPGEWTVRVQLFNDSSIFETREGTFVAYDSNTRVADFNADGFTDLAIGVPNEDIGTKADAGLVNVIYGSSTGLSSSKALADQAWTQDTSGIEDFTEPFDMFGSSLANGDFNGDGYSDLAIGVPEESISTKKQAGAVNVIYGSSAGLRATPAGDGSGRNDQLWHQNSGGIEGGSEASDKFGSALAVGDFNDDGYDDLAIGVPLEDIGTKVDIGMVNVIYGSPSGLSATFVPDQAWSQDTTGIVGVGEKGDGFGASLTTGDFNGDMYEDLAVGVPFEDLTFMGSLMQNAGGAHIIHGSPSGLSSGFVTNQFWDQAQPDIDTDPVANETFAFSLATGDFNDDGYSDLVVGIPHELTGSTDDVGTVHVIHGSPGGLSATFVPDRRWGENLGLIGHGLTGELFGYSIATGDFNQDGFDDLAVGEPNNRGRGAAQEGGGVFIIYGRSTGLNSIGFQQWHQSVADVEDENEDLDHLGTSIASGDFNADGFDDLAIGVPGEDLGVFTDAGAINVIYGSSARLSAVVVSDGTGREDQFWHQNSPSIEGATENGDIFANSLTA